MDSGLKKIENKQRKHLHIMLTPTQRIVTQMGSRSKILVPIACKKKWKNSFGVHSLDTEEKHWAQRSTDLGFLISG